MTWIRGAFVEVMKSDQIWVIFSKVLTGFAGLYAECRRQKSRMTPRPTCSRMVQNGGNI